MKRTHTVFIDAEIYTECEKKTHSILMEIVKLRCYSQLNFEMHFVGSGTM